MSNEVDLSKGLRMATLTKTSQKVGHFKSLENSGYKNLERFRYKLLWLGRIYVSGEEISKWKDERSFESWLQDRFGNGRYEDNIYYLFAFSDTITHKKISAGKYRKVRKLEPFAKFEVKSGQVYVPQEFKKSGRESKRRKGHKIQRIYLYLKRLQSNEQMQNMCRGKLKIDFSNR